MRTSQAKESGYVLVMRSDEQTIQLPISFDASAQEFTLEGMDPFKVNGRGALAGCGVDIDTSPLSTSHLDAAPQVMIFGLSLGLVGANGAEGTTQ